MKFFIFGFLAYLRRVRIQCKGLGIKGPRFAGATFFPGGRFHDDPLVPTTPQSYCQHDNKRRTRCERFETDISVKSPNAYHPLTLRLK